MISQSGRRAVVIAPSVLGSKDHPSRLSELPLRRIRRTIYPPQRIRRRNVEEKDPWRVSRHDNLPSSPSIGSTKTKSGRQGGFDMFPRRVGPGTWYPHHLPVLVVIELNSTTTQKERNQEQSVTTRLANTQTSSNDSLNAWVFVHSL